MKKSIFLFAALIISTFSLAQPDLLGEWTLHYMIIDGTTYNVMQPHPSNPSYDPGITFFEDTNGYEVAGFIHFNGYFDVAPPILIDNNTFTVNEPAVTLGDCQPYCELEFQYLGTILFGPGGSRTFDYEIIDEMNGNKTLIITTPEGDTAVHGNYLLATNSFERAEMDIHPNPAANTINLTSTFIESIQEATILSISGAIISTKNGNDIQTIDVSSLESGLYFLRIRLSEGDVVTKKFIKK